MSKHLNYTAMVEDLTGQRSRHTPQISGRDPQGAFDWCCGNRGLTRIGDLEQTQVENTVDADTSPYEHLNKRSLHHLWQHFTK